MVWPSSDSKAIPAAVLHALAHAPALPVARRCGPWPVLPPSWSLGNEPPLDTGAPVVASAIRHAPSLRWVGASVLTAIAGGLLLGSAIWISSQGQVNFANVAERAPIGPARSVEAGSGARKGDKLVRAETVAAAKQSFKAPMTIRAGDREVIKVRTFTRIATALSLTSGTYAANIPPFNPMRFFAADTERGVEPAPETAEAEASVVKTDLSVLVLEPGGPTLSDQNVALQVEAAAKRSGETGRRVADAVPLLPTLARPTGQSQNGNGAAGVPTLPASGPFRGIDVQVMPENVTSIAKTARGDEGSYEDRAVPIRRGETVDAILRANGASVEDARSFVEKLGLRERAPATLEGMQLRLLLSPRRAGGERQVARAILFGERGIEAIVARNDRGAFVNVSLPQTEAAKAPGRPAADADDEGDDEEDSGVRLYNSLYETALKHDLSRQTVEELIRVFGYDVDFQRRVQPGDGFELFFAQDDEAAGAGDRIEILSAALTVGSDVRRVFRFQGDDGSVEYFDEQGRSLKKFLLRKPIVEARLTSGFGTRFHPILGYSKTHTGVDWANKVGTPIFAAGNGTVIKADWDSGYGRRIEIQHANGYVTTYNHQSAFARGIQRGTRVRQGQVIGYVGSTGLSTGAHLHYEVIVNGHFVDPMKIRVPRGRELDGTALASFLRQREQIESILAKSGAAARVVRSAEAR